MHFILDLNCETNIVLSIFLINGNFSHNMNEDEGRIIHGNGLQGAR